MGKKGIAFLLILVLLCGCSTKAAAPASAPADGEVELPVNNTVMGTVFGENVYYTAFHPYLKVMDAVNDRMIRDEMALTYMLEQEMEHLGVPFVQADFESYAADEYYKECLFDPATIDEIESIQSITGFMKDSMDKALFEGYRQRFDLHRLGDHYADAYKASNPQGTLSGEEYENAAVASANGSLKQLAAELKEQYTLKEGKDLLKLKGKTVSFEDRHNCYMIYRLTQERLRIVDAVLEGCGMAYEMQRDGYSGTSEIDAAIDRYIESMRADPAFYNENKKQFEAEEVSWEQFLLSFRFVMQMQSTSPALYEQYLKEAYEALTENKPDTFEEYREQRLAALHAQCVPMNIML